MAEITQECTPEETNYLSKLHNGAKLLVTNPVKIDIPRPAPFQGTTPIFLQIGDYLAVVDKYTGITAPDTRTPLGWTVRMYREDGKPRSTQAVDLSFDVLLSVMGSVSVIPADDQNIVPLGKSQ